MAKQLEDKEVLALNELMYWDEFTDPEVIDELTKKNNGQPPTVKQVMDKIGKIEVDEDTRKDDNWKEQHSVEEWEQFMNCVRNDKDIMNMRITNNFFDGADGKVGNKIKGVDYNKTNARMACFVSDYGTNDSQAYAVFKGTATSEWRDNFYGARETDTAQQLQAKQWLDTLEYNHIVVSGHSKGGNKAQYCTVVSDDNKISKCISFDGEGFSNEFLEKYADEIKANKGKITSFCNYSDFVNILLNDISDKKYYIRTQDNINSFAEHHGPLSLYKFDGKDFKYTLGDMGEQSDMGKMLKGFTDYLFENASPGERDVVITQLAELVTRLTTKNAFYDDDIIKEQGASAYYALGRYFVLYLQDVKKNDPELFEKYKEALNFTLENELGLGKMREGLFDKLTDEQKHWLEVLGIPTNDQFSSVEKGIMESLISDLLDTLGDEDFSDIFTGCLSGPLTKLFPDYFSKMTQYNRDFTQETKDMLLEAAKKVEEEEQGWNNLDPTKWDCWYRIEKFTGNLRMDRYSLHMDDYYRKIIDIEGATTETIHKIFQDVYEVDENNQKKVNDKIDRVYELLAEVSTYTSRLQQ